MLLLLPLLSFVSSVASSMPLLSTSLRRSGQGDVLNDGLGRCVAKPNVPDISLCLPQITLTLTVTAAYLVYRWLQPRSNDAKQKLHDNAKQKLHNNAKQKLHSTPPEPLKKDHVYDKAELAKFNGTTDGRAVLVAICGKVFDVTAGKDFYGPGGAYAAFAGVDASRMLAKMQMAPDDKDPSIEDLTSSEKTSLESWSQFFDGKYPVVGTYT